MPLVDTHVHAFVEELALAPARRYSPATAAPLDDLLAVLDAAGVRRAVLVQPSFLADDHGYLLECLARQPDRLRGVASLLDPGPALVHHDAWHAAGIRGVRLNLAGLPAPDLARWQRLSRVMVELGWHLEVHATGEQWADLRRDLARWPGPVVLDHLGRVGDPVAQSHVIELARLDHVWVKASAPYRMPDGWAAETAARILDTTQGQRILWGSDWPFTQYEHTTSYPVIWGREPGVHHVADGRLSQRQASLWTSYLWSVHDGSWSRWTAHPRGGMSMWPGYGVAVPSTGSRRCSSVGTWTVCTVAG